MDVSTSVPEVGRLAASHMNCNRRQTYMACTDNVALALIMNVLQIIDLHASNLEAGVRAYTSSYRRSTDCVCVCASECRGNEWAVLHESMVRRWDEYPSQSSWLAPAYMCIFTFSHCNKLVTHFYGLVLLDEYDVVENVWDEADAQVFAHIFIAL